MFIAPGEDIYEGMIVGEANKDLDLAVNVVKAKQQTNTRSSNKDQTVVLKKPRILTLENCLEFINEDELCFIIIKVWISNERFYQRIVEIRVFSHDIQKRKSLRNIWVFY